MINDDAHNLMLQLAERVDSLLDGHCDIWVNDLGYMEISDPDSKVLCKVWVENGNLVTQIEGSWSPKELGDSPISVGKVDIFDDKIDQNMAKMISRHMLQAMHSAAKGNESTRVLSRLRRDEASAQQLFKQVVSDLKKGLRPFGVNVDGFTLKDITFSEKGNPNNKVVCPWFSDNSGSLKIKCGPTATTFGHSVRRGASHVLANEHQVKYMGPILRRMLNMEVLNLRPDDPVKEEGKRVMPRKIRHI